MTPYMVGKLPPSSSHLTSGLVKYVPGRGYSRAVPSQNGDKYVISPPPPQSLNWSSDEIDRRIRAGWMGFKRYKRELYDRPKASLLPLKARMVRFEVVEALLYGCVTWTPLKCHFAKRRIT